MSDPGSYDAEFDPTQAPEDLGVPEIEDAILEDELPPHLTDSDTLAPPPPPPADATAPVGPPPTPPTVPNDIPAPEDQTVFAEPPAPPTVPNNIPAPEDQSVFAEPPTPSPVGDALPPHLTDSDTVAPPPPPDVATPAGPPPAPPTVPNNIPAPEDQSVFVEPPAPSPVGDALPPHLTDSDTVAPPPPPPADATAPVGPPPTPPTVPNDIPAPEDRTVFAEPPAPPTVPNNIPAREDQSVFVEPPGVDRALSVPLSPPDVPNDEVLSPPVGDEPVEWEWGPGGEPDYPDEVAPPPVGDEPVPPPANTGTTDVRTTFEERFGPVDELVDGHLVKNIADYPETSRTLVESAQILQLHPRNGFELIDSQTSRAVESALLDALLTNEVTLPKEVVELIGEGEVLQWNADRGGFDVIIEATGDRFRLEELLGEHDDLIPEVIVDIDPQPAADGESQGQVPTVVVENPQPIQIVNSVDAPATSPAARPTAPSVAPPTAVPGPIDLPDDPAIIDFASKMLGLDLTADDNVAEHVADLFSDRGIDAEVQSDKSLDDLEALLEGDDTVLVAVDRDELLGTSDDSDDQGTGANAVMELVEIDEERGVVVLRGSDGHTIEVPLDDFLDAWEDGDNALVLTEEDWGNDSGSDTGDMVKKAGVVLVPLAFAGGAAAMGSKRVSLPWKK